MPFSSFVENKQLSLVKIDNPAHLIANYPLFSSLSMHDVEEIAALMTGVSYRAGDKIVVEDDFVDAVFFIVEGNAAVTKKNSNTEEAIVATLKAGESIGMSNLNFFSTSGKRTATVTAINAMLLLRLDIKNFNSFLQKHPQISKELIELTDQMLKFDFIKQIYPFTHLSNNEIHDICLQVKEITLPADTLIFQLGEDADCCYLLRQGNVEIFLLNPDGTEHHMAILEPPQLFGEAALLTTSKRNASARTLDESRLLVLNRELVMRLIATSISFAQSLMGFMVNRFRPERNEHVTVHRRLTKDNREIITLHHEKLDKYYNLTEQSWFIWQQLDGLQNIQDITVIFFKKYHAFVPEIICNLLYGMSEAGFVIIPTITSPIINERPINIWGKWQQKINRFFGKKYIFTRADPILTKIYQYGGWIFFNTISKVLLSLFMILSFIYFIKIYPAMLQTAAFAQPNFWIFVLILIISSVPAVFLHEAGHAFAAKALGYKINRVGIGLFGFVPVAFTDTSPLWLAIPKDRFKVDVAGVSVDLVFSGFIAVISGILMPSVAAVYLYLLSLFMYFNAFKNLSVIKEYDGYFLLADVLDHPRLRKSSVSWLVNGLPNLFKYPGVIYKHKAEVYYWIACALYSVLSVSLVFLLLKILFQMLSIDMLFGIPIVFFCFFFAILSFCSIVFSILTAVKQYRRSHS